jgi:hypothetical protein
LPGKPAFGSAGSPSCSIAHAGKPSPWKRSCVQVLVEVEQRVDAVTAEQVDGALDAREVGVVVAAAARRDRLEDHAEPHRVEPVGAEEPGVVAAEADRVGRVRRALVDHVEAVEDQHAAAAVGQPAAGVAERTGRGRLCQRERQHGGGGDNGGSTPFRQITRRRPP